MPLSFDCAKCGYRDRVFADCIADDERDVQCDDCGEWGCGQCVNDEGRCEDCQQAIDDGDKEGEANADAN